MSSSYDRYKRQRAAKDIARENVSRKKENKFFANLKLFVLTMTAFYACRFLLRQLNLYCHRCHQSKTWKITKPNIVTKFYSQDGEVIKNIYCLHL